MNKWEFKAQKSAEGKIRLTKTFIEDGREYLIGEFDTRNTMNAYVLAQNLCDVRQIKWVSGINKATERQARYDRENTTRVVLKLNNKTDADILEKLQQVDNKQGYIKELIRKDLK